MKIIDFVRKETKDRKLLLSTGMNFILKPISMVIQLLYTPLLINYLEEEQYGVWITILSIVNWITTFDIGVGNGMRNVLSVEISRNEHDEAKRTVSTAYRMLSLVVLLLFIGCSVVGSFLNWNRIINTDLSITPVIFVSFFFVCINFILSLYATVLYALQKSELTSLANVVIQVICLLGVIILNFCSVHMDKLMIMAFLFGLSCVLVSAIYSACIWHKFPYLKPQINKYDKGKVREITSIGIKFFVIQIAAIVLYTTDNIIISHIFEPSRVTAYSTANKIFLFPFTLFMALLTPMWSRFTVEMDRGNYFWMKKMVNKMLGVWIIFSIGVLCVVPIFRFISKIWLHRELNYDKGLIIVFAIYSILYMYSGIFSTVINGTGNINLQMIVAVISAIINVPLSIFFAKGMGMETTGVALGTVLSLFIGDVAFSIQVYLLIKKGMIESQ